MSDIKLCFISRWPDGVLLESDFSQLEVVGLAALSLDPVLIEDLLAGRDMHRYFTAKRLGITEEEVTPKERTFTKRMTFQLQYGSGAENMARKLGLTKEACQVFIEEYYARYKGVKRWQESVAEAVYASRRPTNDLTPAGQPRGIGRYESPTGRIYTFFEQDPPEWKKDRTPSFSPTQMKNYPGQGIATADIMAVFRAKLYRKLLFSSIRNDVKLINTVHDSIMADCKTKEAALELKAINEGIAASLVDVMMETWGLRCPVPFKIETKIGPAWSSLEKI